VSTLVCGNAEGSIGRELGLSQGHNQAVAFEPDYYYCYRGHVNYLKPQWNGEEGDAERFAAQAADRIGGVKGDILYFQIATELICRCGGEANLKLISWPRIQKGVAELEKQNGPSDTNLNPLAYMAIKERDGVVALDTFSRLGDDWDREVWRTERYFDSSRNWARETAGYQQTRAPGMIQQLRLKFGDVFEECARVDGGKSTKFVLVLALKKEGTVDVLFSDPPTKVGLCLMKLKGRTLSAPPSLPFTFKMDIESRRVHGRVRAQDPIAGPKGTADVVPLARPIWIVCGCVPNPRLSQAARHSARPLNIVRIVPSLNPAICASRSPHRP
jgi:hypothetical protein